MHADQTRDRNLCGSSTLRPRKRRDYKRAVAQGSHVDRVKQVGQLVVPAKGRMVGEEAGGGNVHMGDAVALKTGQYGKVHARMCKQDRRAHTRTWKTK
eukprot:4793038-Pleurochrysis_carterae.AAC.9